MAGSLDQKILRLGNAVGFSNAGGVRLRDVKSPCLWLYWTLLPPIIEMMLEGLR